MAALLFTLLAAYLIGAIPTAYLIGRIGGVDIRRVGDHNVGAGNVLHNLGAGAFLLTFSVDAAKGATAIAIARLAGLGEVEQFLTGFTAVLGHLWPITLHFHGGRGAATSIGIPIMWFPLESLVLAPIALSSTLLTRNTVLGTALFFAPLPFLAISNGRPESLVVFAFLLPLISALKHTLDSLRGRAIEGDLQT